jgi:integrase
MHYSFSTIKKCYDALNDFYNNLYYSRKIEFSPMLIVQMPSRENVKPKKEIQFFDKEDLDKFISEATAKYKTKDLQKYQYGYCICANMFLGMRVGELLALRWADIDFDNNIIFVHSNLQLINNPKYDKNKKIEMKALDINKQIYEEQSIKTSQNRTIHMNNSAKKYLMLQREYSNFTKDSDFVCCTRDGKHAAITYISENIGRIEEVIDANVKYKGTHIMRHTCASMYFRKGVSVELIAAMLGHSVEVCRNTYIHFIEEQKREVAKLITDFDQVNI